MAKFTVDTHLFRELGELLVGRDSTALVELIKNAYDADATKLSVYGQHLGTKGRGLIRLVDDGVGMNRTDFEQGFLRVASRRKEEGARRSTVYERRFTGAKGIGRLAAHKLASNVEVTSFALDDRGRTSLEGINARIDWDAIELKQTLEDLEADDKAVSLNDFKAAGKPKHGTTINLRKLRKAWGKQDLGLFFSEVQGFEPPGVLISGLPKLVVPSPPLFGEATVRDSKKKDPGFTVELLGDFASGDSYWDTLAASCSWVLEIDASTKKVRYSVAPTRHTLDEFPDAKPDKFTDDHPAPKLGPFFQARVLIRYGRLAVKQSQVQWAKSSSGIRVYMEGFRVPPYGESKNDWLSLDFDYTRRNSVDTDDVGDKEGLLGVPSSNYYGAVFLTAEGSPELKTLVNREGFVPNESYEALVSILRKGTDLATRTRAAATQQKRQERREQRRATRETSGKPPLDPIERVGRARKLLADARLAASNRDAATAIERAREAVEAVTDVTTDWSEVTDQAAMLRVLASVGTQMASFIHELNSLVEMANVTDSLIGKLRNEKGLPAVYRSRLATIQSAVSDMRRHLERQSSYLIDIVTPDARRRRSRQLLSERFDAGARLVQHVADRRAIKIVNRIPKSAKSPPMFPAELTTVFSNLLTNAIKAAGIEEGEILASGTVSSDEIKIQIQNTGERVSLTEAEKWFLPFKSTTTNVDTTLGQGMGLGLTITRSILEEYGAEIHFVKPSAGFATSVEITFSVNS
ncbi:MAG TPA: sensor histidine kinase [Kofleriaceae bacterium]